MFRLMHIRGAPTIVYAVIASAALHVGAMYGVTRIISAQRRASIPHLTFRAGDHAIEVLLIPQVMPIPTLADPAVAEASIEFPVVTAPPELAKIEMFDIAVENSASVSMFQDAAGAQEPAAQTRQRIAQILVTEARTSAGLLNDILEPVALHRIAEQKVEVPKTPTPKSLLPSSVEPITVKSPHADQLREPAPTGRLGVTHGAELLDLPTPYYPLASRRRGEEGLIILRVRVLADGSAGEVTIVSGTRFERLRRAALGAARQARFSPAMQKGKAIASTILVPIRFSLR